MSDHQNMKEVATIVTVLVLVSVYSIAKFAFAMLGWIH